MATRLIESVVGPVRLRDRRVAVVTDLGEMTKTMGVELERKE